MSLPSILLIVFIPIIVIAGAYLLFPGLFRKTIVKKEEGEASQKTITPPANEDLEHESELGDFSKNVLADISSFKDGEFYPKRHKGFAFHSGDELIKENHYLISRIKNAVALGDEFDSVALPLIQRFAEYSQLLPASKSEHHRLSGGLFTHSLEVGLYATNSIQNRLFCINEHSQDSVKREGYWKFGVFVAGLLHDSGKMVTDLIITSDGGEKWNPFEGSMIQWKERKQLESYRFAFNKKRKHKAHDALGNQITSIIMPEQTKQYLFRGGEDVFFSVVSVLSGDKAQAHPVMFEAVKDADAKSSKDDMVNYVAPSSETRQLSKTDHLMMGVAQMIEEGEWKVNTLGSRVWVNQYGVFIPWISGAVNELLFFLDKKGVRGFPKDAETLKNMLVHDGKFKGKTSETNKAKWSFTMTVTDGKKTNELTLAMVNVLDHRVLEAVGFYLTDHPTIPVIVDSTIAAKDAEYFREIYTADSLVNGELVKKDGLEKQAAAETGKDTPKEPEKDIQKTADSPPKSRDSKEDVSKTSSKKEEPEKKAKPSTETNKPKAKPNPTEALAPVREATQQDTQAIRDMKKKGSDEDFDESELDEDEVLENKLGSLARNFSNKDKEWFEEQGIAGDLIVSIGNGLLKERLTFGEDVFDCPLGMALVWPKTCKGHGFEPIEVRQELIDKGWIENNPDKPKSASKVVEQSSPEGRTVQTIVLTRSIAEKFLKAFVHYEAGSKDAKKHLDEDAVEETALTPQKQEPAPKEHKQSHPQNKKNSQQHNQGQNKKKQNNKQGHAQYKNGQNKPQNGQNKTADSNKNKGQQQPGKKQVQNQDKKTTQHHEQTNKNNKSKPQNKQVHQKQNANHKPKAQQKPAVEKKPQVDESIKSPKDLLDLILSLELKDPKTNLFDFISLDMNSLEANVIPSGLSSISRKVNQNQIKHRYPDLRESITMTNIKRMFMEINLGDGQGDLVFDDFSLPRTIAVLKKEYGL